MSSPTAPSPRILVVEDLDHNRELFRTVLARAGYEVETAPNGQAAVAALEGNVFDLVLMDVQMPVMDGLTATRKIRELDPPACDVPIVGMSANVLPEQLNAFQAAGMDDHLGKPFRRAHLLEKVAAWLGRSGGGASPPEHAPVQEAASGVGPSPGAIDDLVGLMGKDWLLTGLAMLIDRIGEAFSASEPSDHPALARQAHGLVSQAALLGFRTFADACSTLENACLSGRGVMPAYAAAKGLAVSVRSEAEQLRARYGGMAG